MRPINCGFRCLKGSLIFLEVVPSIVNPVNKLYSLAYKVQQTFFVPAKKKKNKNKWISEQDDTSFLLTKYYIVIETYFIKVESHEITSWIMTIRPSTTMIKIFSYSVFDSIFKSLSLSLSLCCSITQMTKMCFWFF